MTEVQPTDFPLHDPARDTDPAATAAALPLVDTPAAEQRPVTMPSGNPAGFEQRMPPGREPLYKAPEMFYVVDPTCRPDSDAPPRVHQMPNRNGSITDYSFKYNQVVEVSNVAHAMRFADAGFLVSENSDMSRPLNKARAAKDGHDGHKVPDLRADEVIATLEELTDEALYRRVAVMPGGDGFRRENLRRADLIHFILTANQQLEKIRQRLEIGDVPEGSHDIPRDAIDKDRAEMADAY